MRLLLPIWTALLLAVFGCDLTASASPTNRWYFTATATDTAGLESDYSGEVVVATHATGATVTLAWDASPGTNEIAGYTLYFGGASRSYTNSVQVGTNLMATVHVGSYALTNLLVTVITTGTNLESAAVLSGPWKRLDLTSLTLGYTNPASGAAFFRGMGVGSRVGISCLWK